MNKLQLKQLIKEELSKILNEGIVEGWREVEVEDPYDIHGESMRVVKTYVAPMEGWDEEHEDMIDIIYDEVMEEFEVWVNYAFDDYQKLADSLPTMQSAENVATRQMNVIKREWKKD